MTIHDIEDIKKTTHLNKKSYLNGLCENTVKNFKIEFLTLISLESNITKKIWNLKKKELTKKYSITPSIVTMNYMYNNLLEKKEILRNKDFEKFTKGKQVRENSGITQVTVLTSGHPNGTTLSCEHNCYFCPDEPAHEDNNFVKQPRSYLEKEPAVRRANQNNFEPHLQLWDRCSALYLCGLKIDKLD